MEEIEVTLKLKDLLWLFGFIAAAYAFYKMIKEIKKPNDDLKKQVEANTQRLEKDFKKFEQSAENYEIIIECLFVLINHELDGNGIDKLKNMRDRLQKYLAR